MKGNLGRTRRTSAFVVTGNGNGLAGFATGKAQMGMIEFDKYIYYIYIYIYLHTRYDRTQEG